MIDSHCHVHSARFTLPVEDELEKAWAAGLEAVIAVGEGLADSQKALELAQKENRVYAAVGVHPHQAQSHVDEIDSTLQLSSHDKVVAIGECGLDYYYMHAPRKAQQEVLKKQVDYAQSNDLSLIFHLREKSFGDDKAFNDLIEIIDAFDGLSGVVHSISCTSPQLEELLSRGLYVGVNGIATFTKSPQQIEMFKSIPLDRLLVETDSPFLTPEPFRGRINTPQYLVEVVKFLAELLEVQVQDLAEQSVLILRGYLILVNRLNNPENLDAPTHYGGGEKIVVPDNDYTELKTSNISEQYIQYDTNPVYEISNTSKEVTSIYKSVLENQEKIDV